MTADYWENADFTMFVFCPFDVTFGGLEKGSGKMVFGDFYEGEHSLDGRLWSFMNRAGTRIFRQDITKHSYFKGRVLILS